ncbi:flagellar hook protein FlgE [Rhodovulum iodosum]|uniref:Flagellar hook protein FlgE n=1 Tax=Rhodovulum iodosum TaxID=68291 RepID=A0ABV3XRI8_9RHOB|nr:flagellar hook-basal body complex protein [Rhodovulum robiginosum]RSK30284.1 flagellar hook-basal body complex protein [Rhodovulum robiginosum]
MTISSSLNASVAGLNANATRLATISDNIANSSTYGYRRAETEFHAMVVGGAAAYTAGGVRSTTQRVISDGGALTTTGNATDLAVGGRGMLPVTTELALSGGDAALPLRLMTTGAFRADQDGILRTETGMVLLGWPAAADGTVAAPPRDSTDGLEPVQIDGRTFAGNPTTEVGLTLNLPATDTVAGADGSARDLTVEYFDNLGTSETLTFSFTPTVPGVGASNEWTMTVADSASGGAVVGEYGLTFDDTRAAGGTLASVATVTGGAYDPATGAMTVDVDGGPIELTIGRPGLPGGMTQISDMFAPSSITKNGAAAGTLTGLEVDPDGMLNAIYDSGFTRPIYQIPLVDVPNPDGLVAGDYQTYEISADSGPFFLWDAGSGATGALIGYAREQSATDVADELTNLIETQRAYSSNAKVIQTVDEMLQETTNIKR